MIPQPWEIDRAKERAELGRASLDDVPVLLAALHAAQEELAALEADHEESCLEARKIGYDEGREEGFEAGREAQKEDMIADGWREPRD